VVGILPIALGHGAGGEARAPLGVAVVGGMVFATVLTFFVVPATWVVFEQLRARIAARGGRKASGAVTAAPSASA
jgi:Cu/Ag efflux pump CusA